MIDLVTVAFGGDLPLLRLQARSIARYMDPAALGKILLIVNDPDESACRDAIEAMRGEYGQLAGRLRVALPAELIGEPPASLRARLEHAWTARWRWPIKRAFGRRSKRTKGWGGNSGWVMQQAFKLLAVRLCSGTHLVYLDTKNHFLAPVSAAAFVASDGRARTREAAADAHRRDWAERSFRVLGLEPPPPSSPLPPTVTPVAMERELLLEVLATLEAKLGPLASFFALRRRGATEFMLMFAAIDRGEGLWWDRLATGLPASATAFAPNDPETVARTLRGARRGEARLAGVHRKHLHSPDGAIRRELLALWTERGLIADEAELERLFPVEDAAATRKGIPNAR